MLNLDDLSPDQLGWLVDYNQTIRAKLGPLLSAVALEWMDRNAAALPTHSPGTRSRPRNHLQELTEA
jgi:hypothetical protein